MPPKCACVNVVGDSFCVFCVGESFAEFSAEIGSLRRQLSEREQQLADAIENHTEGTRLAGAQVAALTRQLSEANARAEKMPNCECGYGPLSPVHGAAHGAHDYVPEYAAQRISAMSNRIATLESQQGKMKAALAEGCSQACVDAIAHLHQRVNVAAMEPVSAFHDGYHAAMRELRALQSDERGKAS